VQYIARATDTSPQDVLDRIRAAYRKNTPRRAESEKLMEKIAGAYSRLYQLEEEEQKLREEQAALAHQKPVDEKKGEAVARKLQKVWNNMERLQALREKWREESKKPWRIPSKEVAAIFNLTPNTVDKRVGRIGEQVRQLLGGWREEDGS
jgi:seryl-tRNA synthetase